MLRIVDAPTQIPQATTDSEGRFFFKDLNPGTYRIIVTATGFVRQEYGQRLLNGTGTPAYLNAGQTLKGLTIQLTPIGTVVGRIFDDRGQPAAGAPVQLLQPVYSPQGKSYKVAASTIVDDRGQYRLFSIAPGRYYLSAGNSPGSQRLPGLLAGGGLPPSYENLAVGFAAAFYPSSLDVDNASVLEVKPAGEMHADMTLKRQRFYKISGSIIDSRTGEPPLSVVMFLGYGTFTGSGSMIPARTYDPKTGTFEIPNVALGAWMVQVQILDPQSGPPPASREAVIPNRAFGQAPVNITNADIDGLKLVAYPGTAIRGRVIVDGEPAANVLSADRMRVGVKAWTNGVLQTVTISPPGSAAMNPDGTFQLEGVREGEYLVVPPAPPAPYYLKSIRYGVEDVLNRPMKFAGPSTDAIEITIRSGAAQITGTVTDAKSQPVPGVQVILTPEVLRRTRTDLYKSVATDPKGQFVISGIPPGDYKVFSWEALEQNGYYDPDFMQQYEAQGRSVRLDENSNMNVDVNIIPALDATP